MSFLLPNLLHFGRLLHELGLDTPAGRMVEVANALEHIDIGRRTDFYFTLRSHLIQRPQDLAPFDEAFRVFWRPPSGEWPTRDLRALGEKRRTGRPEIDVPTAPPDSLNDSSLPTRRESLQRVAPTSSSARDAIRAKDFALLTDEEIQEAKRMIAALQWDLGRRRTRRWTAGRGSSIDFRRLARRNLRYGGEPLGLPTRERAEKRRPLVLLCDVSGSMERYARMLLQFSHGLAGGLEQVEAFVFATRLTRITRELGRCSPAAVLPRVTRQVADWAGGTRVGDALHTFNVRWARRVMGHGPVVLLISDGWDRGDPTQLAREMSRLQRQCHRLVWLNPLLGSPAYQPLTRGMQAALPFIDDFLPVHNLASLESLAVHLNTLPPRTRPGAAGVVAGRVLR